jgi:hypothetical protein
MANLRQDRVPDPTLSHTSAPPGEGTAVNGRAAATRSIVLTVALRTSDSAGMPTGVSWAHDSPAAALVVDIITACGGAADPSHGPVLDARFFNLESALLATRRLVWALEGLAEATQSNTAATLAIHSVEEGLTATVASALESLAQGEIVLSVRTADMVRQLPGLIVREAPGGNWRELQWRSEEGRNLAADEKSVLGLIRALGREDPLANAETPAPAPALTPIRTTGDFHAPASLGRSLEEPEGAPPIWKKPWVLMSAGAAVLVLLAVLIIPAMVSRNHSKAPVPADANTKTAPSTAAPSAPSAPSTGSAPVPVPEKPHEQKPPAKPVRQPRAESKTEQPAQKLPAASCDLTEGEIPPSLQRAERLMYAGKLPEAQSAYQRLVGCPSARDRAVEGLRQVKQRIAAQSPSQP